MKKYKNNPTINLVGFTTQGFYDALILFIGLRWLYETKKLNNNVAGTAGEYYVTAEMLRRGFIAATLYSCAKDYDILAYYPKTDKSLKIQVKTSQDKSLKWQIGNHEPVCDDNMFFVFVTLIDLENPVYYIVPSKLVYDRVEERHNTLRKDGKPRKVKNESLLY